LALKRAALKSQQQNHRYEKRVRGAFGFGIEPAKTASTRPHTRQFKNMDDGF
jgi:hypothetical protein